MKHFVIIFLLIFCLAAHCEINSPYDGGIMTTNNGHELYWDRYSFPIQIHVNSSLSLATKNEIYLAIEHWNNVVGARVFQALDVFSTNSEILDFSSFRIINIDRTELGRNPRGREIRGRAMVYFHVGQDRNNGQIRSANVWLDLSLRISRVRLVTIHELGHVLALKHDGNSKSIMYRSTSPGQKLTEEDINHVQDMMR